MISNLSNVIKMYEEAEERLRADLNGQKILNIELENQNRILKEKLMRFKFYGSTDCKTENCMMGVTLFTANDYCITCDPKNYEEIK